MSYGSYYGFRPYVPVAKRRLQAQKAAKKLAGKGRTLTPVQITGRAVATTFWGQAWCRNLESYSDFENRLPRGRTYVRNGSVIDLQITAGVVTALVQGSELYTIKIKIDALPPKRWTAFKQRCAGRVTNLLDLLQGKLSPEILGNITAHDTGLFPAPAEIKLDCSCPDWADMCKHVAAVLYGVGARLDHAPALFFTLRGVDQQELIVAAGTAATTGLATSAAGAPALADADLSAIFGVEIDTASAPPARINAAPTSAPPARTLRKRVPTASKLPKSPRSVSAKKKQPAKKRRSAGTKPL